MDIETRDGLTVQRNSCTVIYDGECRFCVKSKEGIERLSPPDQSASVRYIPYRSLEAEQLLGPDHRLGRPDVAYWIGADGQVRKGLDAILPLLPRLPGGRFLMAFLALPPCRWIALWLYRVVAKNRYRWFGVLPVKPA